MLIYIYYGNESESHDVCEQRVYRTATGYHSTFTVGPYYEEAQHADDDVLFENFGQMVDPDLSLAAYRRYKIGDVYCVDSLMRHRFNHSDFYYLLRTVGGMVLSNFHLPRTAHLDWLDFYADTLEFPAGDCEAYRLRAQALCLEKRGVFEELNYSEGEKITKAVDEAFDAALKQVIQFA